MYTVISPPSLTSPPAGSAVNPGTIQSEPASGAFPPADAVPVAAEPVEVTAKLALLEVAAKLALPDVVAAVVEAAEDEVAAVVEATDEVGGGAEAVTTADELPLTMAEDVVTTVAAVTADVEEDSLVVLLVVTGMAVTLNAAIFTAVSPSLFWTYISILILLGVRSVVPQITSAALSNVNAIALIILVFVLLDNS